MDPINPYANDHWHHSNPGNTQYPFDDWGTIRDDITDALVCTVNIPIGAPDDEESRRTGIDPTESRSKLIARSPDLLRALDAIVSAYYSGADSDMGDALMTAETLLRELIIYPEGESLNV